MQVKEWDEMAREHKVRTNYYGKKQIACHFVFSEEMKYLCGKAIEIVDVSNEWSSDVVAVVKNPNTDSWLDEFLISADMIKLIFRPCIKEVN